MSAAERASSPEQANERLNLQKQTWRMSICLLFLCQNFDITMTPTNHQVKSESTKCFSTVLSPQYLCKTRTNHNEIFHRAHFEKSQSDDHYEVGGLFCHFWCNWCHGFGHNFWTNWARRLRLRSNWSSWRVEWVDLPRWCLGSVRNGQKCCKYIMKQQKWQKLPNHMIKSISLLDVALWQHIHVKYSGFCFWRTQL